MAGKKHKPEEIVAKLRQMDVLLSQGRTVGEASIVIEAWRRYYNTERPHSSLGYKPPAPEAIPWPAPTPRPGSPSPAAQAIAATQIMH